MVVKGGNCTFKLGNIAYNVDSSLMKKTEFASTITETFEQILTTTTYEKLENGNWLYTGQTNSGKFTLVQDSVSGYPISIRVPDSDLFIKFSNMKSNS